MGWKGKAVYKVTRAEWRYRTGRQLVAGSSWLCWVCIGIIRSVQYAFIYLCCKSLATMLLIVIAPLFKTCRTLHIVARFKGTRPKTVSHITHILCIFGTMLFSEVPTPRELVPKCRDVMILWHISDCLTGNSTACVCVCVCVASSSYHWNASVLRRNTLSPSIVFVFLKGILGNMGTPENAFLLERNCKLNSSSEERFLRITCWSG